MRSSQLQGKVGEASLVLSLLLVSFCNKPVEKAPEDRANLPAPSLAQTQNLRASDPTPPAGSDAQASSESAYEIEQHEEVFTPRRDEPQRTEVFTVKNKETGRKSEFRLSIDSSDHPRYLLTKDNRYLILTRDRVQAEGSRELLKSVEIYDIKSGAKVNWDGVGRVTYADVENNLGILLQKRRAQGLGHEYYNSYHDKMEWVGGDIDQYHLQNASLKLYHLIPQSEEEAQAIDIPLPAGILDVEFLDAKSPFSVSGDIPIRGSTQTKKLEITARQSLSFILIYPDGGLGELKIAGGDDPKNEFRVRDLNAPLGRQFASGFQYSTLVRYEGTFGWRRPKGAGLETWDVGESLRLKFVFGNETTPGNSIYLIPSSNGKNLAMLEYRSDRSILTVWSRLDGKVKLQKTAAHIGFTSHSGKSAIDVISGGRATHTVDLNTLEVRAVSE